MELCTGRRVKEALIASGEWPLFMRVFEELEDAGIADVAAMIAQRVIPPGCDPSRVISPDDGGLRPFVELLLCELISVARAPGWSPAMRRARAHQAFTLSGFAATES